MPELELILGRAGSGKTNAVMRSIGGLHEAGKQSVMIVPEQYSHDAERQLCMECGNGICLGAEVLSFSRICSRVFSETGRAGLKTLDDPGRLLLMHLAHKNTQSRLEAFGMPDRRTDFLKSLLDIYDEFKTSAVGEDDLRAAAEAAGGSLGAKIRDLILIFSAYDALRPDGCIDPKERMDKLAEDIGKSSFGGGKKIFIDGFTDFTPQEMRVIDALLKKGADMTVCLTCDGLDGQDGQFELTRRTARRLIGMAEKRGVRLKLTETPVLPEKRSDEMVFIERNIFSHAPVSFGRETDKVRILAARTEVEECEAAADEILELVRSYGYRYRDIAIVARDWDRYRSVAENTLEKYGIPTMTAEKSDILDKPVMTLIASALDVITGDWEETSVFRYLKTGLTGIPRDDTDVLENYVLKWSIRGKRMWTREEGFAFDPEGFIQEGAEKHTEELARVNSVRKAVAEPLGRLGGELKLAETALGKTKALYAFLEDIGLPERLREKTAEFRRLGRVQAADEYEMLWGAAVSAMEQTAAILGDKPMETDEFARLFRLVLGSYEIGTIPPAIDRVSIGGMLRVKRRGVKCLMILGASDDVMPKYARVEGMLSDDDRAELKMLGIDLPEAPDSRLSREMNAIYATLTMASDRLTVSFIEGKRPSFVFTGLREMFGLAVRTTDSRMRTSALLPMFELAVSSGREDDEWAGAARRYFEETGVMKEKLEAAKRASETPRGRLSRLAAEKLYSREINTTASRMDRFRSCRFSFFLQYGLNAKPRRQARLDPPEIGTFLHYLLENVTRDARDKGGLGTLDEETVRTLTKKYVRRYAEGVLDSMRDKSGRFKYLFTRLSKDAETIVLNMAEELKNSRFEPLDFELDFSRGGDLPPAGVENDDVTIKLSGRVDRVDGWVHDGKLYIRVVDYKTGKKEFSLSDIADGMDVQMLLYLFAIEDSGKDRYGREIVPAGVLYAPARDVIVKVDRSASPEKIAEEREKALRRKGLILDDMFVIRAMEDSDTPRYIPVTFKKDGSPDTSNLASLEQLGALRRHIERTLLEMGEEIRSGVITADPYFRSGEDTACIYCPYFEACHFDERRGDKMRRIRKLKPPEAWAKIWGEGGGRDGK